MEKSKGSDSSEWQAFLQAQSGSAEKNFWLERIHSKIGELERSLRLKDQRIAELETDAERLEWTIEKLRSERKIEAEERNDEHQGSS